MNLIDCGLAKLNYHVHSVYMAKDIKTHKLIVPDLNYGVFCTLSGQNVAHSWFFQSNLEVYNAITSIFIWDRETYLRSSNEVRTRQHYRHRLYHAPRKSASLWAGRLASAGRFYRCRTPMLAPGHPRHTRRSLPTQMTPI